MKKLTFLAAAIALVGATSLNANAQSTNTPTQSTQTQSQTQTPAGQGQEAGKEKITQEQLPDAVKTRLQSEVFKDWTVSEVYKVAAADQAAAAKETYEILFTNAENKRAIARFNADGTAIKSTDAGAGGQTGTSGQAGSTTGQQ
ncbi:hypothetical protein [Pontibacter ruber]|uniref:Uncharacterized protein n=1 Tax=Pontibacter ruber TaxID=1343895 RepID=A0ABW5CWP9_9BACT|nr:hypothetical protein [Pontibacter ruber]